MGAQRGMTLLELLVVLVIVAVLLGAATLSLRQPEQARAQQQLGRFQQWWRAACDQALLRHLPVAVVPAGRRWQAWIGSSKGWRRLQPTLVWDASEQPRVEGVLPIRQPVPLEHAGWVCWPDGTVTPGRVTLAGAQVRWDEDGRFFSGGRAR